MTKKKVVINACYGGFSLSPEGTKRLAELQGRKCYFFKTIGVSDVYVATEKPNGLFWTAFDIPNPNEVLISGKAWAAMTQTEREAASAIYAKHDVTNRPDNREDPLLIKVVEELGELASGDCASLRIVEIPVGVEYRIEEYDGNEHIAEVHRTWR